MVVVGKEQTDCKFAGNMNARSSCRQRAMDCKLQVVDMPVEVVGKEQLIASFRQFECQLKL